MRIDDLKRRIAVLAQRRAHGLRTFPVGNYLIIYCVEREDVLILHIASRGRELLNLLKR